MLKKRKFKENKIIFYNINNSIITNHDNFIKTLSTIRLPNKSKNELVNAIDLWIFVRDAAIATYGEINSWRIYSYVRDFYGIFQNRTTFNDDISGWYVSNVNNFSSKSKIHLKENNN